MTEGLPELVALLIYVVHKVKEPQHCLYVVFYTHAKQANFVCIENGMGRCDPTPSCMLHKENIFIKVFVRLVGLVYNV